MDANGCPNGEVTSGTDPTATPLMLETLANHLDKLGLPAGEGQHKHCKPG